MSFPLDRIYTAVVRGRTWRMEFTDRALALIEQRTGRSYAEVERSAEAGSVSAARLLVFAGLQEHHPDVTLADVDELLMAGARTQFN